MLSNDKLSYVICILRLYCNQDANEKPVSTINFIILDTKKEFLLCYSLNYIFWKTIKMNI